MPPPHDLPERYQLVGEIARGGMGAVFKGRDADLGRDIVERAQGRRNSKHRKVDAIANVHPRKPHERPHQEPVVQPIESPALAPPPVEKPPGQCLGKPGDGAPLPKEKAAGEGEAAQRDGAGQNPHREL